MNELSERRILCNLHEYSFDLVAMLQGGITDPGNYWYQQGFSISAIPKDHPLKSTVLTLKTCLIDWLNQTDKIYSCTDVFLDRLSDGKIARGMIPASLAREWVAPFLDSFPFGVTDPAVLDDYFGHPEADDPRMIVIKNVLHLERADLFRAAIEARTDIELNPPGGSTPQRTNRAALEEFVETNYPTIEGQTKEHVIVTANPDRTV